MLLQLLNNIDIILSVALDKNDNLYMGRQSGVYYLKEGKEVKKVLDNQDVFLIMFDNNNNDWYYGSSNKLYFGKKDAIGKLIFKDLNIATDSLFIDSNNNLYCMNDDLQLYFI